MTNHTATAAGTANRRPQLSFRNKRKRLVLGEGWTDESAAETGGFSSFSTSSEDEDDDAAMESAMDSDDDDQRQHQQASGATTYISNHLSDSLLARSPSIIDEGSNSSEEDDSEDEYGSSRAMSRSPASRRSSHKRSVEEHHHNHKDYTTQPQRQTSSPQPQLRRRNSKKLVRRKSSENLCTLSTQESTTWITRTPPTSYHSSSSSSKRRSNHSSTSTTCSSQSSNVTPTKPPSAVQQLPIQPPMKVVLCRKSRAFRAALHHFSKSPNKKELLQQTITHQMETIKTERDVKLQNMRSSWADIWEFQSSYNNNLDPQSPNGSKRRSRIILLASNHPLKITWDFLTVVLTFLSAYYTHTSIRDRSTYEWTAFSIFSYLWFLTDILLNFVTSHVRSDGTVLDSGRAVWSRYLTTWFVIDALSLLPWERMFVRPIIEMQNRRNWITKWFFRSKAVVKVSRILKGRHFRAFGRIAKETKQYGVGGQRLLRLIIKYVPKYVLFYRNMKGVLVLKVLRQIHFARKIRRGLNAATLKSSSSEEELKDKDNDQVMNKRNLADATEQDFSYEDECEEENEDDREESERDLALGYFAGDDCEVSSAGVIDQSDGDDSLTGDSYVTSDDLKFSGSDGGWLSRSDSWLT